jgi:peptide/nickel transport system permease protein
MENLVLRGDMGRSIAGNSSVRNDLVRFLPASLELAMFAVLLFLPAGIVLGVLSARKAGGWMDAGTRGFAILGMSIPIFWLGVMMQIVFFGWLNILPATGRISSSLGPPPHVTGMFTVDALLAGNLPMFADAVRHMILPAVALALGSLAVVTRMTRSSVLDIMGHDFVRTARSKGLAENIVLYRHVLRNAMIPIVTIVAVQIAGLIAWQFLVETIFSWPGIGSWAVQSILTLDFQVIMAVTLFGAILYVTLNFVADLIYIWLDPRIRI